MRMEANREYRIIRLWTNKDHAYTISFKHPKYQKWWICVGEEWWRKPEFVDVYTNYTHIEPRAIEFARVIWAK